MIVQLTQLELIAGELITIQIENPLSTKLSPSAKYWPALKGLFYSDVSVFAQFCNCLLVGLFVCYLSVGKMVSLFLNCLLVCLLIFCLFVCSFICLIIRLLVRLLLNLLDHSFACSSLACAFF